MNADVIKWLVLAGAILVAALICVAAELRK